MAESEARPTILWLDDKKGEIRDEVEDLESKGFRVLTARDVISFQNNVQELAYAGRLGDVWLVVLDIMLENVDEISRSHQRARNGNTANGYAAGLVFLEQVLVTEDIFADLKTVPIALNSKRAMNEGEKKRILDVETAHSIDVQIFEKSGAHAITHYLTEIRVRREATGT